MKGIAGRVTAGLPVQARLDCVDNTEIGRAHV